MIDRIGSGDAYIAGILYGILRHPNDYERIVQYGDAFSVLKNTVVGDVLCSSLTEIDDVIATHCGKTSSEMKR